MSLLLLPKVVLRWLVRTHLKPTWGLLATLRIVCKQFSLTWKAKDLRFAVVADLSVKNLYKAGVSNFGYYIDDWRCVIIPRFKAFFKYDKEYSALDWLIMHSRIVSFDNTYFCYFAFIFSSPVILAPKHLSN
jgi:hypothetical protein